MNEPELFRCLADPTRFTILKLLREADEPCVGDLVAATGKEQTNVSHHLAQLRACGLVATRQDGKRVRYRLAHPRLATLLAEAEALVQHLGAADAEACASTGCC